MLVFDYDDVLEYNLSKTFGEVTWKYKIDELIDKFLDSLNELINKVDSKTTDLSSEEFEILKNMKNCTSCKDNTRKFNLDGIHELIKGIENNLAELEKEEQK